MRIIYKFATNEMVCLNVEVSEEVELFLESSRRAEHANNERQRYHRAFSLDAVTDQQKNCLEDRRYACETNMLDEDAAEREKLWELYASLSDLQKKRICLLLDGYSMRAIAKMEGVAYNTVYTCIVGVRKIFHKFEGFHFESLVYKEGAF